MIRALLFDFDGLILDTETAVFEGWRAVYEAYGHVLPMDRWLDSIGTDGADFDPLEHLESVADDPLPEDELHGRRRRARDALLERLPAMPGVESWIGRARQRGLGLAVASSSPLEWVEPHLDRLGLVDSFDALVTLDHVSHAKPAPDLYLRAMERLEVAPSEAIALEDSPNGVAAAVAAGVFCVAVPGPMTRSLSFRQADLVLDSLDARTLDDVIALLDRARSVG